MVWEFSVIVYTVEINCPLIWRMGFPGGSVAKNLPTMQETLVPSLGREDPLKGMTTHSTILAREIPQTEPGGLQPIGSQESATAATKQQ